MRNPSLPPMTSPCVRCGVEVAWGVEAHVCKSLRPSAPKPDRDPLTAEQLSAFRAHVQAAHDEVESGVILGPAWQTHAAYTGNPATVLELLDELDQTHARIAELEQQAGRRRIETPADLESLPFDTAVVSDLLPLDMYIHWPQGLVRLTPVGLPQRAAALLDGRGPVTMLWQPEVSSNG